ncbi:hypothetical protein GCM10023318_15380 [Nocardia callitridis]|uniref:Uncharacterized protein n=1 Tax=Nocardia callitridis TaxID=648753 RepID=A0ABP9K2E1_9NOCA
MGSVPPESSDNTREGASRPGGVETVSRWCTAAAKGCDFVFTILVVIDSDSLATTVARLSAVSLRAISALLNSSRE